MGHRRSSTSRSSLFGIALAIALGLGPSAASGQVAADSSESMGGGASTDPGTGGGSTNPTLDRRAPLEGFTAVLEASPTSPTSPTSGTSTSPVKGVTGTTSFTKLSSGTR